MRITLRQLCSSNYTVVIMTARPKDSVQTLEHRSLDSVLPMVEVYHFVFRDWRIFVKAIVVFLSLALVKYTLATPVYEARIMLVPNSFQPAQTETFSSGGALSGLIGHIGGNSNVGPYLQFRLF